MSDIELTGSINQRIKAVAARFEEALHPHLFDWMLRLFGLFTSVRRGSDARVRVAPAAAGARDARRAFVTVLSRH